MAFLQLKSDAGGGGGGRSQCSSALGLKSLDARADVDGSRLHDLDESAMVFLRKLHRQRMSSPGTREKLDPAYCRDALFAGWGRRASLRAVDAFLSHLDGTTVVAVKSSLQRESPAWLDHPSLRCSPDEFRRLISGVDPGRLKFCGETDLHWLELFRGERHCHREAGTTEPEHQTSDDARAASFLTDPCGDGDDAAGPSSRGSYYSLVAYVGLRSPGTPLAPPVLFDLSDVPLDSRWLRDSLDASVRSCFFHKGDILVLDTTALSGWDGGRGGTQSFRSAAAAMASSLDDYLWNAIDPIDGAPLRLCLLWMPSSSSSLMLQSPGHATVKPAARTWHASPATPPPCYGNPIKVLFSDLRSQLRQYPLSRISTLVEAGAARHVTAVAARDVLASTTVQEVKGWYAQCGYCLCEEEVTATRDVA
jgi:hypothetical protein